MSQLDMFEQPARPQYPCAAGCGAQVNPIYGPASTCLCWKCWDEWLKSDMNPLQPQEWLNKKRLSWITA